MTEWAQDESSVFIGGVREVYERAQADPGPDPRLPAVEPQAQRVTQQWQYQQELWSICQTHVKTEAPMSVLCQRVERFLPELFTFVAEPQEAADNPSAEGQQSAVYGRRW